MCEKCGCSKTPEKQDPKQCSPEQIKECHGDTDKHPCEDTGCQKDKKQDSNE
jgi:hypothetical protein